ncbi:hypothetical protein QE152_g24457 [Popillia japonica]|uniref:Uncharacterized protein n=1 Tax=Popillia japonica TaxID=7064 RepID=A0AAW1KEV8_POPJA
MRQLSFSFKTDRKAFTLIQPQPPLGASPSDLAHQGLQPSEQFPAPRRRVDLWNSRKAIHEDKKECWTQEGALGNPSHYWFWEKIRSTDEVNVNDPDNPRIYTRRATPF